MPFQEAIPSFLSAGFHIPLRSETMPFREATESSGENGSGPGESGGPPPPGSALLLEDGFFLLLENGSKLLLE